LKFNKISFVGLGLGLISGYFLLKNSKSNKKYFLIGGIGLAGGLLANLIGEYFNANKEIQSLSDINYVKNTDDELFDEETGNIELIEKPLNNSNKINNQKDIFDIDLEF